MIVLHLFYEHEIGKTYTHKNWGVTITDAWGKEHKEYAYKVIKKATQQEWVNCILELNPKAKITIWNNDDEHYYWVQMD